ncbi:MAG: LPS export ABC transporter periplasmic protein LptC [Burkholderiaceae bacterium]
MMDLLRAAWDRVSIYLPVLLMAVMALGSYLVLTRDPAALVSASKKSVAHEVDYFMRLFSIKVFDVSGRLKNEVSGAYARHFQDDESTEIDKVSIRSVSPQGRPMQAVADRALTNSDATEIELFNNVVVIRLASPLSDKHSGQQLEFRGNYLRVLNEGKQLSSNMPVLLVRGYDQFTADAMDYDEETRVINLLGRVKGVLATRNP